MEETGKLLFILWGVPEPTKNRHVVKQRAMAALLMAQWINKEFRHYETLNEELIDTIAALPNEVAYYEISASRSNCSGVRQRRANRSVGCRRLVTSMPLCLIAVRGDEDIATGQTNSSVLHQWVLCQ